LERFKDLGNLEPSRLKQIEEQLNLEREKTKSLDEENKRLKAEGIEKDRKIKELTSRLDFLRKNKQNVSGADSNMMTHNTSIADISMLETLNG
jgi:hypothetical protein